MRLLQSSVAIAAVVFCASGMTSEAFAKGSNAGMASWYQHGSRTASGERFNADGFTAAHRSLPFGTKLRVTNRRNGKAVTVRVNDRGPFARGRLIDVSRGAARALGMIGSGTAPVQIEVQSGIKLASN